MFTQQFPKYACVADSISCEIDGFEAIAFLKDDCDTEPTDYDCYSEEQIKAWHAQDWQFVGVCVVVRKAGVTLTDAYNNALWGVDCNFPGGNNGYLLDVANDLLGEAIAQAKAKIAELCAC